MADPTNNGRISVLQEQYQQLRQVHDRDAERAHAEHAEIMALLRETCTATRANRDRILALEGVGKVRDERIERLKEDMARKIKEGRYETLGAAIAGIMAGLVAWFTG